MNWIYKKVILKKQFDKSGYPLETGRNHNGLKCKSLTADNKKLGQVFYVDELSF